MTGRILTATMVAIVLLAPFHEGGRAPVGLLILHTLAILYTLGRIVAGRSPRSRPAAGLDPLTQMAACGGLALFVAGCSALRAAYPLAAALGAWDLVVPYGVFVVSGLGPVGHRDELIHLRAAIVGSTSLQAAMALVRYRQGGAAAAGSTFLNRNHLAAFLLLGFFLCLTAAFAPGTRRARFLWGAAAAVNLAGITLLESRGAFLALITVLLVFGVGRLGAGSRRVRYGTVFLVIVCGLLAFVVLKDRFGRADDPYRYDRLSIWSASWRLLAEHPFLGHGPGMFPHVAARHYFRVGSGPVFYGRTFSGAHSAYLTLAAEIGLPAALGLAAAALALVVLLLRQGDGTEIGAALAGSGLGLLALLVQAGVEDLQERPALTMIPALLAGVALGAIRLGAGGAATGAVQAIEARSGSPSPEVVRRRRSGWTLALAGTAAIYLELIAVLLPYLADRAARTALGLGRAGLSGMERAAALDPLQPEYRHDLAMAILNSGPLTPDGFADVETDLLEAFRLKPIDYRFPLLLGRLTARFAPSLFGDRSAPQRAVALYGEAVRLAPLNPLPGLELSGQLLELKRLDEALAAVRGALRLEPNFLRARTLEASILLESGRKDEARASLASAEAIHSALAGYTPDSSYAREIVLDAKAERDRLAARLGAKGDSAALRF